MSTKTKVSAEVLTVTMNSKTLLSTLLLVGKAISPSPIVVLMENVHVAIKPGNIHFTGSDYKQTITSVLEYAHLGETGAFMLPYKKTVELLKTLPSAPVTIEHCRTETPAKKGENEIVCVVTLSMDGKKFKLSTDDHIDYPKPQIFNGEQISFPITQFEEALRVCLSTVSDDDLKPAYCGIHFNAENGDIVSCDGGNMTVFATGVPLPCQSFLINAAFAKMVLETMPVATDAITIELSEKSIRAGNENLNITSQLIEERFVDYSRAIPSNNPLKGVIEMEDWANSLKRALIFSSSEHMVEHLFAPSVLSVQSADKNYGNDSAQDVSYEGDISLKIGIQGKKVLTILQKLSKGKARIEMTSSNRAMLIYPEVTTAKELTILTMPLMLDDNV